MIALQDNMHDILDCYNATITEDSGREMEPYDYAKVVDATVNDHAETVVKNKFAPSIRLKMRNVARGPRSLPLPVPWLGTGCHPPARQQS